MRRRDAAKHNESGWLIRPETRSSSLPSVFSFPFFVFIPFTTTYHPHRSLGLTSQDRKILSFISFVLLTHPGQYGTVSGMAPVLRLMTWSSHLLGLTRCASQFRTLTLYVCTTLPSHRIAPAPYLFCSPTSSTSRSFATPAPQRWLSNRQRPLRPPWLPDHRLFACSCAPFAFQGASVPNIWRYEFVICSQKGKNVTGVPVSVPDSRPSPPPSDAGNPTPPHSTNSSITHAPSHLFI